LKEEKNPEYKKKAKPRAIGGRQSVKRGVGHKIPLSAKIWKSEEMRDAHGSPKIFVTNERRRRTQIEPPGERRRYEERLGDLVNSGA